MRRILASECARLAVGIAVGIGIALSQALMAQATDAQAAPDIHVMFVGTVYFVPGGDQHNVETGDILTDKRQRELDDVVAALSRFRPNAVIVESTQAVVDQMYPRYLDGSLEPASGEIVQLGFRLAKAQGLERVIAINVGGSFPFEAVDGWARAHERGADLDALSARAASRIRDVGRRYAEGTVGDVLRFVNRPQTFADDQALHLGLLRFGAGDEQPGVRLNAELVTRNLAICAAVSQSLEPGDRAVVFYGYGHGFQLRECLARIPGFVLVDPAPFLPN